MPHSALQWSFQIRNVGKRPVSDKLLLRKIVEIKLDVTTMSFDFSTRYTLK